jgi:hypothetical protein
MNRSAKDGDESEGKQQRKMPRWQSAQNLQHLLTSFRGRYLVRQHHSLVKDTSTYIRVGWGELPCTGRMEEYSLLTGDRHLDGTG